MLSSSVVFIWVLLTVSAAFRSLETQQWLTTAHFQCRADLTSPITRHWHSSRQFQGHQSKWVLLPLFRGSLSGVLDLLHDDDDDDHYHYNFVFKQRIF